jgi:hypothetical protein
MIPPESLIDEIQNDCVQMSSLMILIHITIV